MTWNRHHSLAGLFCVAALAVVPFAHAEPAPPSPEDKVLDKAAEQRLEAAIPPNSVVMHVGDSMVFAGFNQALSKRLKPLAVRMAVHSEKGTATTYWSPKVAQLVNDNQPDLVIINLGGNELEAERPEALAPVVRHIVKGVGDRPCVWVLPPLWDDRPEPGILSVIRKNAAPCRVFDSNAQVPVPLPRKKDGIHPTLEGGATWFGYFWAWLVDEHVGGERPWALRPAPGQKAPPEKR